MSEPPDLPRGPPMTSTAALPLVFCSWSKGMYAISLHGSKSEYLPGARQAVVGWRPRAGVGRWGGVASSALGSLGHDVLRRADEDGEHERRGAERGERRGEGGAGEAEREEGDARREEDRRRDHGRGAPAPLAEDEAAEEHHEERHDASLSRHAARWEAQVGEAADRARVCASARLAPGWSAAAAYGGGEGAHEGGVVGGIGKGRLELGLPGHLDEVDAHAVRDHEGRQVANVRRRGEVARRLAHCVTARREEAGESQRSAPTLLFSCPPGAAHSSSRPSSSS